jgi:hypothetical protein
MELFNLAQYIAGDTWEGLTVTIARDGSAVDLTGAFADFRAKTQLDAPTMIYFDTIQGGVTILQPASAGVLQVTPTVIDVPPANYTWVVTVTLSSGEIDTFAAGTLPIIKLI